MPPMRHDGSVSNEFKPGHPILFWGAIVIACLLAATFIKMGLTVDDCSKGEKKQWVVSEFKWVCGKSGIAFAQD
jgi:hypothetical protein